MPSVVEMHFADGSVIDAWESFDLRESFTDPLSNFTFTVKPPRSQFQDYRMRLRKGELVTILVDGANQGTFLIQTSERGVTRDGGVSLTATCNTVLVTPYEGSVDPKLAISTKNDTPISDVILKAMEPFGFTFVAGDSALSANAISGKPINGRGPAIDVDALKGKEAQAQDGETAYDFCKRVVTRLGVVLRVGVDGVLLLTRPDYEQAASYTLVQSFGLEAPAGDVMLYVDVCDTNAGQFSECVARGQASFAEGTTQAGEPRALVAPAEPLPRDASPDDLATARDALIAARAQTSSKNIPVTAYAAPRPLYSSTAAAYKPRIIKDKNARDNARAQSVAKLALTKGAQTAYVIKTEVAGFKSSTGRIWGIDTTARVYCEAEELDEDMWIMSRELCQDRKGGQSTKLTLIPLGSLVLGD